MPDEREQQVQDPEVERDEPTDEDEGFTSAQTRAGSNLPNAAGHRGDGTHE
jgi:hypothetical protein